MHSNLSIISSPKTLQQGCIDASGWYTVSQGEIGKAEKPIDFILSHYGTDDPMYLYVKWVLEMEKTNWQEAKNIFLRHWDWPNLKIQKLLGVLVCLSIDMEIQRNDLIL